MSEKLIKDKLLNLYLAAPLFNKREREYNRFLKINLEKLFSVYLPQEDGLLLASLVKEGVEVEVAESIVFDADIASMKDCHLVLAVLDGATVDEGVAFEVGYMYALGRTCVGLQGDVRRQLPTGNNPMISCSLSHVFEGLEEFMAWAAHFVEVEKVKLLE